MIVADCLFLFCIAWIMFYDTIYAAQDIKDDTKAGIKSSVVRHQGQTRTLLIEAALTQVALLCCTGLVIEATAVYFISTCFGSALILETMIRNVNLNDLKNCL